MKTLYASNVFSLENPSGLQKKVFFEMMIHLCRRGQENLQSLKKQDFLIKKDASGIEYIVKSSDELIKNRRAEEESLEGGVIYETGDINCPVASFKMYLEKLLSSLPCSTSVDTPNLLPLAIPETSASAPKKIIVDGDHATFSNCVFHL